MALQGFDKEYYLAAKLAALQAEEDTAADWEDKDETYLEEFLTEHGFDAESHYQAYGWAEGLAPNALFNAAEYKLAKATDMYNKGLEADATTSYDTVAEAEAAFDEAWPIDPYLHYVRYGSAEGINPSNAFDESEYLASKLADLKAKPDTATEWADNTVEDVRKAFVDNGLSALGHYQMFGKEDEEIAVTAVPDDEQVKVPENEGKTFDLTTDTDTIEGTDDMDTINGVSSSLSSEKTLNAGDIIDGGAGTDTLEVAMKGSFGGFTGDGKMENVEIVNLTSDSNIARDFDATGVTGVEQYNIDATKSAVNLKDLGDLDAAISISDQAKGTFSVAYATDVTKGTTDVQALAFEDVGTKDTVVTGTIAGVEELGVTLTGDNYIDFTAAAAKTMTVTGDGSLTMATGPAALKVFDATDATGDLDINLAASTDATAVALGAGDDKLTVGAGDVTKNAELTGGEGADTLVLAAKDTVQYVMSEFETLNLANTAALTFSAANASDIETIQANKLMSQGATFASLGSGDYTVELQGANANAAAALTLDNAGTTTIAVNTPGSTATAAAPDANGVAVTLSKSDSLVMSVAEKMNYTGTVTATKATSVDLDVQGQTTAATISAGAATGVVISAVENDSSLTLTAAKATDLNVTAAKDLDLTGATLTALESLTVDTAGDFDMSAVSLAKVASVTLEGAGSVELGNLGAATQDGYAISLTATGLSGDETFGLQSLEVGNIDTKGQNITVDAAGVLGLVTIGNMDASGGGVASSTAGDVTIDMDGVGDNFSLGTVTGTNVTINAAGALGTTAYGNVTIDQAGTLGFTGANLEANTINAIATGTKEISLTFVGGIDDDTFIVTSDASLTGDLTIDVTGDIATTGDALALDGTVADINVKSLSMSGIEVISIDTAADANTITVKAADITGEEFDLDATSAANDTLTVAGTTGADTVDLSSITSTGINNVADINVLASKGADIITASAAIDTISYTDITAQGGDTINAFATTADVLEFSAADLNALAGAGTYTAGGAVVAFTQIGITDGAGAATVAATGTAGTFIYDANTGYVMFDASGDTTYTDDGSTGFTDTAGDDVLVATLGVGGLGTIVAGDFDFVA